MRLLSIWLVVTCVNLSFGERLPFPMPLPKPSVPLKPGQPALRAELREVTPNLPPSGIMVLPFENKVLTLYKDGEFPSSFELSETFGPPPCKGQICPMMPSRIQVTQFKIGMTKDAGCGSRRLYAREVVDIKSKSKRYRAAWLSVLDHTSRICDDKIPALWEVTLYRQSDRVRQFQGDPKPVDTAPDCSGIDGNTACIMLYAPATCQLDSLNGNSLAPPVIASGGNSCLAIANLRKSVCERGLDYKQIDEADVTCSMENPFPCPMPMCAAPPEDCDYIADPAKDVNGCPSHPCGRLVCKRPSSFEANNAELLSYCKMDCEAIRYIQAPQRESCWYQNLSQGVVTKVSDDFNGMDGCQARRSLCQYVSGREWTQAGLYGYQCSASSSEGLTH